MTTMTELSDKEVLDRFFKYLVHNPTTQISVRKIANTLRIKITPEKLLYMQTEMISTRLVIGLPGFGDFYKLRIAPEGMSMIRKFGSYSRYKNKDKITLENPGKYKAWKWILIATSLVVVFFLISKLLQYFDA